VPCHYNLRAYLSRGDEVPINRRDTTVPWPKEMLASDDKGELINSFVLLGSGTPLQPSSTP